MNYDNLKKRIDSIFEKYIVGRVSLLLFLISPLMWSKLEQFDDSIDYLHPFVWLKAALVFVFLIYSYIVPFKQFRKINDYLFFVYTFLLTVQVYFFQFAQFAVIFLWLNFIIISLTISRKEILINYYAFSFIVAIFFSVLSGMPIGLHFPYLGHFIILLVCVVIGMNKMKMLDEFKRYERTLDEKNEEFNLFLQNISAMVVVKDDKNNVVMANQAHSDFVGKPLNEIEGKNLEELISKEEAQRCFEEDLQIINSDKPILGKIERYVGKDGDLRWLRMNQIPFKSPGYNNKGLIIISEDITDYMETKKQSEANLIMFRKFFENAPLPIVLTDFTEERKLIDANNAAVHLFGFPYDELLNIKGDDISHEEDRGISAYALLKEDDQQGDVYKYKKRYIHKNGDVLYCDAITTVIRDGMGNPLMMLCMLRDITNENELDIIRKENEQELEKSNKELEQFAYVVSHDLREPLRMITSYIQLLGRRYISKLEDREADEFMEYVVGGAKRMDHLIQDILEYSRVGRKNKELSMIDLNEVYFIVVQNLRSSINEKKADIEAALFHPVYGNRTMMIALLQNLIGNALKYSHPDRIPAIRISQVLDGDSMVLSVEDNGIGIEAAHLELIFAVFQRLHTREEYSGTGIGLALCKKIVDNMGGDIWVESEPNKGSTFFVKIPLEKDDE